jgi:phosphatidate cytidylyltransferase
VSNIRKRLLFFFTALPLLLGLVIWLPHRHYLAFNLLVAAAAGVAALEVCTIFRNRGVFLSEPAAFLIAAAAPMGTYLHLYGVLSFSILPVFYILICMALFVREIFHRREEEFHNVLFRLSGYFFIIIYPGFFSSFAVRITSFPDAGIVLLAFIAATYLNDSAAWASGMMWGNGNRNILTVSPNKSLVGFIFGFSASVISITGFRAFFPGIFPISLPAAVFLGSVLGVTTILGDLTESALKRSGVLKDSGTIIPGRGGLLDSIDSPLFNAPLFYYLYKLLIPGLG